MKMMVVVKIKCRNVNVISKATEPENVFAPPSMMILQRATGGELIFKLQSNVKSSTDIWSVRRTIDDFIFSACISMRAVIALEKHF